MSEAAKWYVIHTYSGYENKVAQTILKVVENRKLHDLIPEVRVPTEMVMEKNDKDEMREVERKIFPGYVLVKMILTDDSWYVVRNTRGVTGFVGPGSKPVPLSEKEVAALDRRQGEDHHGSYGGLYRRGKGYQLRGQHRRCFRFNVRKRNSCYTGYFPGQGFGRILI